MTHQWYVLRQLMGVAWRRGRGKAVSSLEEVMFVWLEGVWGGERMVWGANSLG